MRVYLPLTHSFLDYPSPDDSCVSLYMTGCEHKCIDCSNPNFQNYMFQDNIHIETFNGKSSLDNLINLLMQYCKRCKTNKISLMGGDPLFPLNIYDTQYLLNLMPEYNFCIYTGYTVDYIKKNKIKGFNYIKCGTYIQDLKTFSEKTDEYIQFASKNQELYDLNLKLLSVEGRYYF